MRLSHRFAGVFFFLAICLVSSASAEIKIKVVDPQDAAIAGAQVQLLMPGDDALVATQVTSAEGLAVFRETGSASYRVNVLAPGFAAEMVDLSPHAEAVTVRLRVAPEAKTVVVTATRTPAPEQETASSISLLSGAAIETMQPTSAADALRFLPAAVVDVAGQRGGLGSLFVRGPEEVREIVWQPARY